MATINGPSREYIGDVLSRVENLREQMGELRDGEKAIFAEAKAQGYTPFYLRHLLKLRQLTPNEIAEDDAMKAIYRDAAGLGELPLFKQLGALKADTASRESIIDALKPIVPDKGSIIVDVGGQPIKLSRDASGNVVEEVHRPDKPDIAPAGDKLPAKAQRQMLPPPDVNEEQAEALGARAFQDDHPIVKNPFPAGDVRRRRWDKGWRDASGGDGMGPSTDPKPGDQGDEA